MIEKLRDLWYGLAARRVVRKTAKTGQNRYSTKNMQHVSGAVDKVLAFPFLTLRNSGAYPVYIKVCYTVKYQVYCKRDVFLSHGDHPHEGQDITVVYPKDDPRKAILVL